MTNFRCFENATAKVFAALFAALALTLTCLAVQPPHALAVEIEDASYGQHTSADGTVYLPVNGWGSVLLLSPDAQREIDEVIAVTADNTRVTVSYFDRFGVDPECRLRGDAIGACTISYQVKLDDGTLRTGAFKVCVYEVALGGRAFADNEWGDGFYVLYKGAKAVKPSIKGVSGVTWSTTNKAVAKVSAKGSISYAGLGACNVQAKFGSVTVSIPVDCTYKKAYQAVKNGFADMNTKLTYNQKKRMQKNFRDCSSFVSRCYWDASLGRKIFAIGGKSGKSWAFTAASQAKWLNQEKKCIAKKAVDPSLLLAGDTIHTETQYAGQNNEYRHIDHVTLYVGNGMVLTTGGWSEVGGSIGLRSYYQDDPSVRFIGRPCAEPQMSVAKATLTKKKGPEHTLQLKVQFQKGTVKWTSSNKKVATVSSKGKVTAKKKGKTTITAKVAGKTFKCKITVK